MSNVYSVTQVNSYIKNMFTQDFLLQGLSMKGEVSNCKYHSSGHIYFTLKDSGAAMNCVMFAGYRKGLSFALEEGQEVIVSGSVDVYERDGRYQMYAKDIRLAGLGLLYERFEALKKELSEMGMFDSSYKKPIPKHIKTLGVVTASTGAAVRDIIQVSSRRNPFVQIILYPAQVQGEGAAESIAEGISALERYGVDVMIVGRGGGSIEDLWAFNERVVAETVFNCSVPIISAVGHETDTTIIDYVSDLRAPTPSAAAELAVYDVRMIFSQIEAYESAFVSAIHQKTERFRRQIAQYERMLTLMHPAHQIREKRERVIALEEKLYSLMRLKIEQKKHRLHLSISRLNGLSPLQKLEQGLAYVANQEGKSVFSIEQVSEGETLRIQLKDGQLYTTVLGKEKYDVKQQYGN